MIDRKYNRTADTGRFELVHRGTPVPVPIYVGIDLRVEGKGRQLECFIREMNTNSVGKPCKTGRLSNNGASNQVVAPNPTASISLISTGNTNPSAPSSAPQATSSTPPSSSSTTPAEARPLLPHPSSALSAHYHSFTAKSPHSPASLRLRREMTQPSLNRLELMSASDNLLDRNHLLGDILPFPYRSNVKSNPGQAPLDIRSKTSKTNPTRLSADYFPTRQVSRSKANDSLPSPKGKRRERDERTCSSSPPFRGASFAILIKSVVVCP